MAKIVTRVRIPKGLKTRVTRILNETLNDEEMLETIGKIAVKNAVANISEGKQPKDENSFKNPTLSDGWMDRKRSLVKQGTRAVSGQALTSKLSRLAFTGQFLRSMLESVEVIDKGQGKRAVQYGPQGQRNSYSGVSESNTPNNEELGDYLVAQGRDWRGVSEDTRKQMVRAAQAKIRRLLSLKNK